MAPKRTIGKPLVSRLVRTAAVVAFGSVAGCSSEHRDTQDDTTAEDVAADLAPDVSGDAADDDTMTVDAAVDAIAPQPDVVDVAETDTSVDPDVDAGTPNDTGDDANAAVDVVEPSDIPLDLVELRDAELAEVVDVDRPDINDASDATTDGDSGTSLAPNLTRVLLSVILPGCGGGSCHLDGASAGGLDLNDDDALYVRLLDDSSIGMPYVTPGDLELSYLWHKVAGTHRAAEGTGARMPFGGFPLRAPELELVSNWITAGAPP